MQFTCTVNKTHQCLLFSILQVVIFFSFYPPWKSAINLYRPWSLLLHQQNGKWFRNQYWEITVVVREMTAYIIVWMRQFLVRTELKIWYEDFRSRTCKHFGWKWEWMFTCSLDLKFCFSEPSSTIHGTCIHELEIQNERLNFPEVFGHILHKNHFVLQWKKSGNAIKTQYNLNFTWK